MTTLRDNYSDMIAELRAFYPDDFRLDCKSRVQIDNYQTMKQRLDAYADAHPRASALELRRKSYEVIGEDFIPFVFKNSPFYGEAGINGGWGGLRIGNWVAQRAGHYFAEGIPEAVQKVYNERRAQRYFLCCGNFVDSIHHTPPLTTVLQKGFVGILAEAEEALTRCRTPEEREFVETAIAGLKAIHRIQLKFADRAAEILEQESLTEPQRTFMTMIATHARQSPWEPPRTFYEGLSAFWFIREILALVDGLAVFSIGHPDAMLIDLYERDLAAGRLTREEAFDLVCRYLLHANCHYNEFSQVTGYNDHELEIPVTVGGCDAAGHEIFNDLTRMLLQAHRELDLVFPKMHCRYSAGSNPEYLQEIAQDVRNGHCVHSLFNDDAFIPTLFRQGHTLEEARRYICTGCWGGQVDSSDDTDTANYFNLARVLEATIYPDPEAEQAAGITFEQIDDALDFCEVRDRVCGNLRRMLRAIMEDFTAYGLVAARVHPRPVFSACLDGCLESLKDTTAGGSKFNVRDVSLAFPANLVDSLLAIKTLCFDRNTCSLPELLGAVRNNWQGAEALRQQVLSCPHWGDDSPDSTALMRYVVDLLANDVDELRNERGGKYYLAAWVYREYRFWGEKTKALPDGRHDGEYLAQSLNPSHFRNMDDVTTVVNALGRLDHSRFATSNVNLMLDRENATVEVWESLFRTFAKLGMHLLQPNCFSREELLDARIHPERYASLIVKVTGFSARFVALSPEWQDEVLARKSY